MRKLVIAAFGGALASGFLVLGTPLANAGPCTGMGAATRACGDCMAAAGRALSTPDAYGCGPVGAGIPSNNIPDLIDSQCHQAGSC
jgi:hypothetical protein